MFYVPRKNKHITYGLISQVMTACCSHVYDNEVDKDLNINIMVIVHNRLLLFTNFDYVDDYDVPGGIYAGIYSYVITLFFSASPPPLPSPSLTFFLPMFPSLLI